MAEEKLITPQWLMIARRRRRKFIVSVVCLFGICTLLAFWALPTLVEKGNQVIKEAGHGVLPGNVKVMLFIASWFRVFWVMIALGCGGGILAALTGKIDNQHPLLNVLLLAGGLAAVGFTLYVFYLPAQILLQNAK
jgi:hypothetical protein